MIFSEIYLKGAYIVDPEKVADERGFFARSWCQQEFQERGLDANLVQCNLSYNRHTGTVRGMHFQAHPCDETKLVRCTKGAIYDVIIDLRPNSITFKKWFAAELTEQNHRMLYVPKGFAHGFQTLADESEIYYQMSQFYAPESARGVRWNDPAFKIVWPRQVKAVSRRDEGFKDFDTQSFIQTKMVGFSENE